MRITIRAYTKIRVLWGLKNNDEKNLGDNKGVKLPLTVVDTIYFTSCYQVKQCILITNSHDTVW